MRRMLQNAFEEKVWSGSADGARSGPGSTMEATARARAALPGVMKRYNVKTFLDAPCGDWYWMSEVDLGDVSYIGADIAASVVDANKATYTRDGLDFRHLDITSDPLPDADLMMCRDCLFHLKHKFRWLFFENFAASNIPYLMMTMHHLDVNRTLTTNGNFAAFSPLAQPFNFPEPIEMIHETVDDIPEGLSAEERRERRDRSMGIWRREDVIEVLKVADRTGVRT